MALLLALTAGVLLAWSLPPIDVEWLGWIMLTPLFVAVRGRRALEAVGLGMLAGGLCGFMHVGWQPGAPEVQMAYLPFLWLAMLLGVVAALAAWAGRRWEGTRSVLFVACAGVAAEWVTAYSPLPLNLAVCQYRTLSVIQIASVTGIWGVSLLVWGVNAALADAVLGWRPAGPRLLTPSPNAGGGGTKERGRGRAVTAPGGVALAALAVTAGYSHLALARTAGQAQGRPLRAAAIQEASEGEIAPFVRLASLEAGEVDREALTRRAAARGRG